MTSLRGSDTVRTTTFTFTHSFNAQRLRKVCHDDTNAFYVMDVNTLVLLMSFSSARTGYNVRFHGNHIYPYHFIQFDMITLNAFHQH